MEHIWTEEEFKKRCGGKDILDLSIHEPCNFDFGSHCAMDAESLSPALQEDLKALFARTYTVYKETFGGDTLTPQFNRLTHILLAMDRLEMLTQEEKQNWVTKYAALKINAGDVPFAQNWNRVWLFVGFGIDNVLQLPEGSVVPSVYLPSLADIGARDCFNEGRFIMTRKFIIMRSFFNQPLTPEERKVVEKFFSTGTQKYQPRKELGDTSRFETHLSAL